MKVTIASGGGVVGPMELGPVDTETIDRGLGQKIEDLVRDSFSNLSPSGVMSLPHPNEPWSAVAIVDSVRAGRLPGNSSPQLEELLQQSGADWHRPSSPSGVSPLFRHWVHSREEDAEGVTIYRPQGFDFPPSWGREGFDLRESGTFIVHEIGPGDEPVTTSARWTIDRLHVGFNGERPPYALDILSYDENTLRVRNVPDEEQESNCSDWRAELLAEPPGPATLRVEGVCTHVPGFSVSISRHHPQGSDPRELLLDLTIVTPRPPWSGATVVGIVYAMETEQDYDTVTLLPEGVSIPVERIV